MWVFPKPEFQERFRQENWGKTAILAWVTWASDFPVELKLRGGQTSKKQESYDITGWFASETRIHPHENVKNAVWAWAFPCDAWIQPISGHPGAE
jgi:hypothetical protein